MEREIERLHVKRKISQIGPSWQDDFRIPGFLEM